MKYKFLWALAVVLSVGMTLGILSYTHEAAAVVTHTYEVDNLIAHITSEQCKNPKVLKHLDEVPVDTKNKMKRMYGVYNGAKFEACIYFESMKGTGLVVEEDGMVYPVPMQMFIEKVQI